MTPTGEGAASFRTPAPPARLNELPPYPPQDVPENKARLESEGRDVINLGAGDPALQGYALQRGLPAYRAAIAGWVHGRFIESVATA